VFKIRNGSADRHHSGERNDELTDVFADGSGPHVLMITNHGVHEWQVVPGLSDTGGQNVYVNQFTEAPIDLGYRVTIVNRGGYPHPVTGRPQVGSVAHPSGRARILYIEDGTPEFVPKEDMDEHIAALSRGAFVGQTTSRSELAASARRSTQLRTVASATRPSTTRSATRPTTPMAARMRRTGLCG